MQDTDTRHLRPVTFASAMDWMTTSDASATSDDLRRARRTAGAVLVGVLAYTSGAVATVATGQTMMALPASMAVFAMLVCGVALRAGVRVGFVANTFVAVNAIVLFSMLLATGGESVGFLIATPVVPAFAMLVGDRRSVWFWSGATVATIAAVLILTWLEFAFPIRPDLSRVAIAKFFIAIVVVGTIFGIAQLFLNDRFRAEQALSQAREREEEIARQLRLAARTARLGHWSFDHAAGVYLSVSEEYARIFGYTVDEFLKRYSTLQQDMQLVHAEDRARVAEAYLTEREVTVEYRIVRADGSVRTVLEIEMRPADTPDRQTRSEGTLQDITDLRQVEGKLRAARDVAEAANRAKSAFLANMSHELRTPLSTIIGYSELLQEQARDLEQTAQIPDLQRINAAGTHLVSLISDVLDYSTIEAGKTKLHVSTFAVMDLVDGVVATCRQLVEQNGNTLNLNCAAAIGEMRSDMTKVRQVLFNLLSNAAKFTDDGQIEVNVRRDAVGDDAMIVLEVRDSGIGMTAEQMKVVFEAFTRADNSATIGKPGTGLGLTITREYCHLLGGELALSSTLGEGSVFTATLQANIFGTQTARSDATVATVVVQPSITHDDTDTYRH